MNIIIAGATGFIGQKLVKHFLEQGFQISVIGRDILKIKKIFDEKVKPLTWNKQKELQTALVSADLVINLTGCSIGDKRWTRARKNEILQSRLIATQKLVRLCCEIKRLHGKAPALFNASAIGIYGLQETLERGLAPAYTEESLINFQRAPDFLAFVARQWELVTKPAKDLNIRVVNLRFGVVLGKEGGILKKLLLSYKLGLGAKIASGQQAFTWVALTDLISAIDFLIAHPSISGPVNITAPEAVSQKEFAQQLGKALRRPVFLAMPKFVIRWLFGQMGDELLIRGQHVQPKLLLSQGFEFRYPEISRALQGIYHEDRHSYR
jgi:uncharacterized protein (TIGR01777 family)